MLEKGRTGQGRKPIFDLVRKLMGRGFRQSEAEKLDEAIERALRTSRVADAGSTGDTDPGHRDASVPIIRRRSSENPATIGERGIALIKKFEGCAQLRRDGLVEAYPDPGTGAEPFTIGWGATGPGIEAGTIWTQEHCDERFASDLSRYARDVASALGNAPTSQAQFDALVSFHYNTGAIRRATLTRLHKSGDFAGAAREFARWNKAGGRVLKGLVRRRAEEARLYCEDDRAG